MKTLAKDRDRAEILERLRRIRPDSAALWGRMSAHQMVCHLGDSFRMALGQKAVSAATGFLPRVVIRWSALYLPLRWPPGIATRPEVDQKVGGTPPGEFTRDVEEVVAFIELVTAQRDRVTWQVHPMFGRMSCGAWLRWAYLHTDHHLRQFGE